MSKSLMPTVVITWLTTAVLMLGYQYMTTTNALNSQIEEKDEAISRLNAEMLSPTSSLIAGAEPEAITTPAAPATPAASASAPEGPSPHTGEQWIYGNARADRKSTRLN